MSQTPDLWGISAEEVERFLSAMEEGARGAEPWRALLAPTAAPERARAPEPAPGELWLTDEGGARWWALLLAEEEGGWRACVAWPDDAWLLSERDLLLAPRWLTPEEPLARHLCAFPTWARWLPPRRLRAPLARLSPQDLALCRAAAERRGRYAGAAGGGLSRWAYPLAHNAHATAVGGNLIPPRDPRLKARERVGAAGLGALVGARDALERLLGAWGRDLRSSLAPLQEGAAALLAPPPPREGERLLHELLGDLPGALLGGALSVGEAPAHAAMRSAMRRAPSAAESEHDASSEPSPAALTLSLFDHLLTCELLLKPEGLTLALRDLTLERAQARLDALMALEQEPDQAPDQALSPLWVWLEEPAAAAPPPTQARAVPPRGLTLQLPPLWARGGALCVAPTRRGEPLRVRWGAHGAPEP